MAKKKRVKKVGGTPPTKETAKPVALRLQVESSPDTPMYYANYAEVAHSQHDFVFSFVRVPAKPGAIQLQEFLKTGTWPVEPACQVTFPPTLARPLIEALEKQIAAYETVMGRIPKIDVKGKPNGRKK